MKADCSDHLLKVKQAS